MAAQDQANFNWQQYAADNPDVLASGYGNTTYSNPWDQMWGHYNEANRLGDHRAYTGYESIQEPTLAENFGGAAPAAAPAAAWAPSTQGVYIPGHGYVGSAQNIKSTVQGYDDGWYGQGSGAGDGGYSQNAQGQWVQNNDQGLQLTDSGQGYWTDQAGLKYDNLGQSGGYFDSRGKWVTQNEGDGGFRRRNDALNTYKHSMGNIAGWDGSKSDNYEMDSLTNHRDWEGQASGRIKTGDKMATRIQWNLNPEHTEWIPTITGKEGWDTNADERMRLQMVIAMASLGAGAYLAPAAAAANAGSAAATAGTTMSTSQALQLAGIANTASGNKVPGLGIVSGLYGGYGALGNLASGTGSVMDAVKLAQSGAKVYGGVNNLMQDPSNPTGGGTPGQVRGANSQMPGSSGEGSDMGWLDTLMGVGRGMYSANKNENYADELRQERARSLAERQPFLDRVGQLSGDAGAENFRTGGTWQAAERVASNRFNRGAAAGGTLANPTDRERLLQDHFMGKLGEERTSARNDLNSFDEKASRDAFMKGLEMDRMKNSPLFMEAGRTSAGTGGPGGLTPDVVKMLQQIPGGMAYLQQLLQGQNAPETPADPYGPPSSAMTGDVGPTPDYDFSPGGVSDYDTDYSSWFDNGSWGE